MYGGCLGVVGLGVVGWGLLAWGGRGVFRDLVVGGVFSGWNRINLLIGGLVFWLWVDFLG